MGVTITSIFVLLLEMSFIVFFVIYSRKHKIAISKETVLWFLPVFLFMFTLYFVAVNQKDDTIFFIAVAQSIVSSIKTFTFEINTNILQDILHEHTLFTMAFYLTYFLAVFTVVASLFGLLKYQVFNYIRSRKILSKSCDIVIDYTMDSLDYCLKHKNTILWLSQPIDRAKKNYLFENKIPYISSMISAESFTKRLKKQLGYNFIVFHTEPNIYQMITQAFSSVDSNAYQLKLYLESQFDEISLVRKAYLDNMHIKENLQITTFSRYELIAQCFVSEYTVPSRLKNIHFNENRTIKADVTINVIFCGFGKVNASLFEIFVQNNQLVTEVDDQLKAKQINYHIIDKDKNAINAHQINLRLNRMKHMKSDLPLFEDICKLDILTGDINSLEVSEQLHAILTQKNSVNLCIVSYGNDFENASFASYLKEQYQQDNIHVACRIRHLRLTHDHITYFGNEEDIMTHQNIIDDDLQHFAMKINQTYQEMKDQSKQSLTAYRLSMPSIEYYSNLYHAMNIRFKLHLLGLDMTKGDVPGLSKEAFITLYGKQLSDFSYDHYFEKTKRNVIAYSEKLRWNAFYLMQGYQPMRLSDIIIEEEKVIWKNHQQKLHACLTSYQGLDRLHHYVINHPSSGQKLSIEAIESYRYDYMCFDQPDNSLIDKLLSLGYKIYKKNET